MPFSSYAFRGRRFFRRFAVVFVGFVSVLAVYASVELIRTYTRGAGRPFGWLLNKSPVVGHDDGNAPPAAGSHPTPATLLAGCMRPRMEADPVNGERRKSTLVPLQCGGEESNWISTSNGTFHLNASVKQRHGDILCQYTPILRDGDDFRLTRGQPIKPMSDGAQLTADAFEARCVASDGSVHFGTYSGVAFNPAVAERCRQRASDKNDVTDENDVLDILVFGFDSVSRMTWMRQLPETHRFFVEQLGGVVVKGYNIVGDGTPQALLPMLTGQTETELPEARRGFDGARPVDGHPWLWRRLVKERNYATQWGEDGAHIGTSVTNIYEYICASFDVCTVWNPGKILGTPLV
jgi:Protein of unknown function (DUF229)